MLLDIASCRSLGEDQSKASLRIGENSPVVVSSLAVFDLGYFGRKRDAKVTKKQACSRHARAIINLWFEILEREAQKSHKPTLAAGPAK